MTDKIKVGWATWIGIALGVAGLAAGVASALADAQVAGLPPAWATGVGVVSLWLVKIGRYAQAAAGAGRAILDFFDHTMAEPVQIPPTGFEPDAATVAALDGSPTHPGEAA